MNLSISIARRVNQLLPPQLLKSVLETLIINSPLKLLRFIPQCGRSKVAWIYVENTLTSSRRATFISFAELLESFLSWLEVAKLTLFAWWQKVIISRIVEPLFAVGDRVYTSTWGVVEVLDKDWTHNDTVPRLWIETEDTIERILTIDATRL